MGELNVVAKLDKGDCTVLVQFVNGCSMVHGVWALIALFWCNLVVAGPFLPSIAQFDASFEQRGLD